MQTHTNYAILGGGVSGCFMADRLTKAGCTVTLFEKSRGLGGRLCHRRSEYGRFLHGLQFLHLRDERVESILRPWLEPPHARTLGGFGYWNGTNWEEAHSAKRIQFFPETSTFCKAWTEHSTVHMQTRIGHLEHSENGWTLHSEDRTWSATHLVLSLPYTQMLEILPEDIEKRVSNAIQVKETPACAVMLRFETAIQLPNEWAGGFVESPLIRFLSKQDSCSEGRHWTLVLNGEWTDTHWKVSEDEVLLNVFEQLDTLFAQPLPALVWCNVHWWRYAFSQSIRCEQRYFPEYNLTIIGDGMHTERGLSGAILSVLDCPIPLSS